ncbi:MAG: MFS transporter [Aigarchaeota archaeon]|nr:MFS transporter [Aigarchaeota archaeon]MDW8093146.1 MFS transporter [Nitrososphaerota archaeon]
MILFFYLVTVTLGISLSSTYYLVPVFMEQLGYSDTLIGIMGSIVSLPYLMINLLARHTIGRLRDSRAIAIACVCAALSASILLNSGDLLPILIAEVMIGVATSFYFPLGEIMISGIRDEVKRRRAFGLFGTSWTSGFMLGPALSGIAINSVGAQASFYVPLVASLTSLPLSFLQNLPLEKQFPTSTSGGRGLITPAHLAVALYTMALSTIVMAFAGLAAGRGVSPTLLALAYSVYGLSRMVAFLSLRNLPFFGTQMGATTAALITSFALLSLTLSEDYLYPVIFAAIGASATLYVSATFLSMLGSFGRDAPSAVGRFESCVSIGFLIGPGVSGAISDNIGFTEMLVTNGLLALSAGVLSAKRSLR